MVRGRRLAWRRATQSDIGALQRFTCCPEPKPVFGGRKRRDNGGSPLWLKDAQAAVRDLRPNKCIVLLGEDQEGQLGAVVAYEPSWPDETVFLGVIAVSVHLKGMRVGDEAMQEFSEALTEEALRRGIESVWLEGNCSPDNHPSLLMLSRWNWRYVGQNGSRYQRFAVELIIAGGGDVKGPGSPS